MRRRCFPFYLAAILLTIVYLFLLKIGYLTGLSALLISDHKLSSGNDHDLEPNHIIQSSSLSAPTTKISHGGSTFTAASPKSAPTPPARNLSKIIVVAKTKNQSTEWVDGELPDWDNAIYVVDDLTARLHTTRNKGNEANAYLTYLVNNYEALPDVIAFVHYHRIGKHNDARGKDNVESLRRLRLQHVLDVGYANLRCQTSVGCPAELRPLGDDIDPEKETEVAFAQAWRELFGGQAPPIVATPCCAQFAVSREQVLRRSRGDYARFLGWLMRTELSDDTSGRIMEYLWHIIFGREAVFCPSPNKCYCDLYGVNCGWIKWPWWWYPQV